MKVLSSLVKECRNRYKEMTRLNVTVHTIADTVCPNVISCETVYLYHSHSMDVDIELCGAMSSTRLGDP